MGARLPRIEAKCSHCGKAFPINRTDYRVRVRRSTNGVIFCSRECFARWKIQHSRHKKPLQEGI